MGLEIICSAFIQIVGVENRNFKKGSPQIGLSRSKRCFGSFQRSTFFGADIETLINIIIKTILKLNMQTLSCNVRVTSSVIVFDLWVIQWHRGTRVGY